MSKLTNLNLLYFISFMDLFAVGLTVPLFSNHLRELGASHFTIGLLSSFYSGLQVITGPIVGSWSDVRDRQSVLIVTLLLSSLGYLALGFTDSIIIFALGRLVLGVTKHTQTLTKAVITDLLPAEQRAFAFSRSTALGSLGFMIGPTLGGHLSELEHGFHYVCVLTSFLFIVNVALTFMLSNITSNRNLVFTTLKQEIRKSLAEIVDIQWRTLWDMLLLRFIFGFSVTLYFSQQALYLREQFNLSQRHIGYTISYFSAMGMLAAFSLQEINTRFYKNDVNCFKRLIHFFVLMAASSFCLYFAPRIEVFLVVLIPFSLSCTVLRIVSMELMLKQAARNQRGSLSGASNSIMSIARFLTPVSAGLISDGLGEHTAMLFSAFPPLIGATLAVRMMAKNKEGMDRRETDKRD